MEEPSREIVTEMLLAFVGRELAYDLNAEENEVTSLRKALLYLIFLTQERAAPAGQDFIQYLLTDYPAIKERDTQYLYDFMFDENIKNASLENDEKQVVLNKSFFEKLNERIDNEKLKGEPLTHEFYGRLKAFFKELN